MPKRQTYGISHTFGANDEIDLACLSVYFPVADAYEGINPFRFGVLALPRRGEALRAWIGTSLQGFTPVAALHRLCETMCLVCLIVPMPRWEVE